MNINLDPAYPLLMAFNDLDCDPSNENLDKIEAIYNEVIRQRRDLYHSALNQTLTGLLFTFYSSKNSRCQQVCSRFLRYLKLTREAKLSLRIGLQEVKVPLSLIKEDSILHRRLLEETSKGICEDEIELSESELAKKVIAQLDQPAAVVTLENFKEVSLIAKKYQFETLKKFIDDMLSSNVDESNFFEFLVFSQEAGYEKTANECVAYLKRNPHLLENLIPQCLSDHKYLLNPMGRSALARINDVKLNILLGLTTESGLQLRINGQKENIPLSILEEDNFFRLLVKFNLENKIQLPIEDFVDMPDVTPRILSDHNNAHDTITDDNFFEVVQVADRFQLIGLKKAIEAFVPKLKINHNNVYQALGCEFPSAREAALKYLQCSMNTQEVLSVAEPLLEVAQQNILRYKCSLLAMRLFINGHQELRNGASYYPHSVYFSSLSAKAAVIFPEVISINNSIELGLLAKAYKIPDLEKEIEKFINKNNEYVVQDHLEALFNFCLHHLHLLNIPEVREYLENYALQSPKIRHVLTQTESGHLTIEVEGKIVTMPLTEMKSEYLPSHSERFKADLSFGDLLWRSESGKNSKAFTFDARCAAEPFGHLKLRSIYIDINNFIAFARFAERYNLSSLKKRICEFVSLNRSDLILSFGSQLLPVLPSIYFLNEFSFLLIRNCSESSFLEHCDESLLLHAKSHVELYQDDSVAHALFKRSKELVRVDLCAKIASFFISMTSDDFAVTRHYHVFDKIIFLKVIQSPDFDPKYLIKYDFKYAALSEVNYYDFFEKCTHLKELNFENLQFNEAFFSDVLLCCPNVQEINFSQSASTGEALAAYVSLLPNLRKLDFSRCNYLKQECLVKILERGNQLEELILNDGDFPENMGGLKLKKLTISRGSSVYACPNVSLSKSCPNLQELDYSFYGFSVKEMRDISQLKHLIRLKLGWLRSDLSMFLDPDVDLSNLKYLQLSKYETKLSEFPLLRSRYPRLQIEIA